VRSVAELALVDRLIGEGLNDCQIARETGIPRKTLNGWRLTGRTKVLLRRDGCAACGHPEHDYGALPAPDYAYLLGLYLGDGHIVHQRRGVYRLSVYLDQRYPGILDSCAAAIEAVIGRPAGRNPQVGCVAVYAYSKQWPCLFPQHGPGGKHERRIALADWQQRIVDKQPEALLRGLVHSDGCRSMNRISSRGKRYEYSRYTFTNASDDIRRIFTDACDAIGVEWRRMNARNISVARRASVAKLDAFIGPKR
jgi:hypothetical protein